MYNMEDFNIGAMKARNIAAQFGVIEKAEMSDEEVMKAHQVGDMHPNGKWVWTEYKPGRFDWRPLKGRGGVDRNPKKGDDGGAKKEDESSKKTATSPSGGSEANAKKAGLRKEEGKEKKTPTLDDHAKKTPTKTLENAVKSPKAPGSVKGAAEAELKERKNKEISKKLNLHSKGELATELTRIASEWDSYDDAQKTQTKQAIAQAHSTVLKDITSGKASDEAIAALADLTSIQNFFKDSASQPKQVGDIVEDLVADLKAKNASDTTAGKEKLGELSKKVSGLSDGKSLSFSSNDKNVQLKRERTFDDGTPQFTMYIDGVGVYTTIKADDAVKKMNELFPDAEESKNVLVDSTKNEKLFNDFLTSAKEFPIGKETIEKMNKFFSERKNSDSSLIKHPDYNFDPYKKTEDVVGEKIRAYDNAIGIVSQEEEKEILKNKSDEEKRKILTEKLAFLKIRKEQAKSEVKSNGRHSRINGWLEQGQEYDLIKQEIWRTQDSLEELKKMKDKNEIQRFKNEELNDLVDGAMVQFENMFYTGKNKHLNLSNYWNNGDFQELVASGLPENTDVKDFEKEIKTRIKDIISER